MKLKDYPKIINLKQLKEISQIAKKENLKISFANGCFDIIHPGHIRYLKAAKSLADILVLGVNNDKSVEKLKGKGRPYFPLKERLEILSSIIYIDFIIPFSEDKPLKIIKILKPDFHCKGGDYKKEEVPERETVEKLGGKVLIVGGKKIYSSSELIKNLKK
jgi:rfaE bifunctional protein nucleotidyltransferase chain/domain